MIKMLLMALATALVLAPGAAYLGARAGAGRFRRGLVLPVGAGMAVAGALFSIGWQLVGFGMTSDTELLNGQVTGKEQVRVSCSHSYSCNCKKVTSCSGSGANRSCSTTESCDTCYEHSNDYDWMLRTSVGSIEVDRVDRQGVHTPPRYSAAKAGDPVAVTHRFTNYVLAAQHSLFNAQREAHAGQQWAVPAYPLAVYDLHYVDRAIPVGASVPDLREWNREIALALRELGPSKQVNIVVVLTAVTDRRYAEHLRASWLGGKKNDVVVVLGVPEYPKVQWAEVLSWTTREDMKVNLRDELQALPELRPAETVALVASHIAKEFERRRMRDFEYLADEIEPSTLAVLGLIALSLAAAWGTAFVISRR